MIEDAFAKAGFLTRRQTLAAFLVFICLSVYALNANPFAGQTVAPFDRLLQFQGWFSIPSDRKAVHLERSDILDSQLPTWMTLKDEIRKGESPLWYPNGAGGQPISLELCNPTFLLFLAVKDNGLAYYLVCLAKLVISGFGCYLLLRIFLGWLPSVWGGIVFMLCGFNAAWFFWEQVATAMWVPWVLWATAMYLRTEEAKWLPVITVTSLLMIFGGFPAVAGFGFYSLVLLIIVWTVHDFLAGRRQQPGGNSRGLKRLSKKAVLPLLAVVISFLMSAIAIIPFLDYMSGINLGYRTSGGMPLAIHDMLLFFTYEEPPRVERTFYVGALVCIFALLSVLSLFRAGNGRLKTFVIFNISLVIVTILIAFGLLPHRLIEAMPILSNNPKWFRILVVTLLGLASLSAAGLDLAASKLRSLSAGYLTPANAQRLVVVILIGVIAVQFHYQKKLFNRFNAVVPSAWFYPMTPTLRYVREHLKPLQSVIADNSYWFAGTLGAYGIPEWYAHSFRTDTEKEVLGRMVLDPFSSPTSMYIEGGNIQFNSPLMDKLAIKYLLVNRGALETRQLLSLPESSPLWAPPLPSSFWKQHISISNDMSVGAFGFMFSTYGEEHAPANVRLTLYADSGQQYAVTPELDRNAITDNRWAFFAFPEPVPLKRGGYYLVLSLPGYNGPGRLTALATKTKDAGSFLEADGMKTDFSLAWKIGYYQAMDLSGLYRKWDITRLENNIVLFDNKQVTNSAYFVKDLDPSDIRTDYSGLSVEQPSPDVVEVTYSKGEPGWVVLPMHRDPGWKAYVDGRPVEYDSYLGMMPAIPVRGAGSILFKYRPTAFYRGMTISLAGLLVFLIFTVLSVRKARRP